MLPSEMPTSRNEQKPFRNDQIEHETLRQEFEETQIQFAIWCVFKSRSDLLQKAIVTFGLCPEALVGVCQEPCGADVS